MVPPAIIAAMPPKKRRPRNVHRHDHNYFHGWVVQLTRRGRRYQRYFPDDPDRKTALQRALTWRDQMLATLPPPRKIKRTYSLNTTGVVGVYFARDRTRSGTLAPRYAATWIDAHGRTHKRSFSVTKYGKRRAFKLARVARQNALVELLRPASP